MTWLPEASTYAPEIDALLAGLTLISLAVLGLVFALMFINVVRFRAGTPVHRAPAIAHKSWGFEIGWTSATLLVFFGLFLWATRAYVMTFQPPAQALQIYVIGKQWMWKSEYPGGQREINALHVPIGRAVQLLMTSEDVIHDFSLPAFRVKHDVLPGRYESFWFNADRTGTFNLYCTQFCGTGHSHMTGSVTVMTAGDYADWLGRSPTPGSLVSQGEEVFVRNGCGGCHIGSAYAGTGSTVAAPSLVGLSGRAVTLTGGRTVIADASYLHDSILDPQNWRVAGYSPVMPSFHGVMGEDDVAALVAYLQTLGNAPEANTPTQVTQGN
jgi:cytochrome c oxidase subunit 2